MTISNYYESESKKLDRAKKVALLAKSKKPARAKKAVLYLT